MISYAITVKDELTELKELINLLLKYKGEDDEIIVIQDSTFNDESVKEYLLSENNVQKFPFPFQNDFSELKNFMIQQCNQEWIFNIDADEKPNEILLQNIKEILVDNRNVDAIWVPRINIVNGLTDAHIKKWKWTVNENGWVNWPNDAQCRIFKNKTDIFWTGYVHEHLTGDGLKKVSMFPALEEFSLYHIKDIARQEKQNEFYSTITQDVQKKWKS